MARHPSLRSPSGGGPLRPAAARRRTGGGTTTLFLSYSLLSLAVLSLLLVAPSCRADCPIPGGSSSSYSSSPPVVTRDDGDDGGDDDDGRTLHVHVVPHTHDDVGWLKTVDQYYHGFNLTIQRAQVRYILDTTVLALRQNPNRTFTYVETAFFSMWWREQADETREYVRALVREGRWSFANGGWCMHDEASTHFAGMIDQTTLGHSFLKSELGAVPRVGWQLDPFGHSAAQASVMTSLVGFDALYFGRIDYQDLAKRHDEGRCEGFWSSSPSLGDGVKVFWGLTGGYVTGYGPPPGFCFDDECNDEYLVGADEARLKERIAEFLGLVAVQANRTKGGHIMLTVGSDFQYSNAFINFENYDLLIDSVLRYQSSKEIDVPAALAPRFDNLRIFYSTPEIYTRCKHNDYVRMVVAEARRGRSKEEEEGRRKQSENVAAQGEGDGDGRGNGDGSSSGDDSGRIVGTNNDDIDPVWDTKTDDFFPYSDCDHCFWTGYFTSRQGLKRLERVGSAFLHAARQIESYREGMRLRSSAKASASRSDNEEEEDGANNDGGGGGSGDDDGASPLRNLEEAMGVAQHHDAVSGTSKQHVAFDYARRIQGGLNDAQEFAASVLRDALLLPPDDSGSGDGDAPLDDLAYCQLLNVTVCPVSQDATTTPGDKDLYVVVYNALGNAGRDEVVSVPVASKANYTVERLTVAGTGVSSAVGTMTDLQQGQQQWEKMPAVLVPNANNSETVGAAPYKLVFESGTLPPVGAAVYRVRAAAAVDEEEGESSRKEEEGAEKAAAASAVVGGENGIAAAERTTKEEPPPAALLVAAPAIDGTIAVDATAAAAAAAAAASRRSLRSADGTRRTVAVAASDDDDLNRVVSNGHVDIHFEDGLMTRVTSASSDGNGDSDSGFFSQDVKVVWGYYTSLDDDDAQRSGAYIFRPKTPDEKLRVVEPDATKSWIFESDLITEVHVGFTEPWIKQITRIVRGAPYVEVEYTVGPVPIDDGVGKEIVARYVSGIRSDGTFHTDSNGREFQERRRSYRPTWDLKEYEPVAGNYYPVNAAAYVEDGDSSLAVLVDRSQGGASLVDGTLELMVQRRILKDDARGAGEPLNETDAGVTPYPPWGDASRRGTGVIVSGVHRILFGGGRSGARLARSYMDRTWSPPHVFVASSSSSSSLSSSVVPFGRPGFSAVGCDLPENVLLLTHSVVESEGPVSTFLVRFAHQYAVDEDETLSAPVRIDLEKFYEGYVKVSAVETTLSGNQELEEWERTRLRWGRDGAEVGPEDAGYDDDDGWVVELNPMEIKTFLIRLST